MGLDNYSDNYNFMNNDNYLDEYELFRAKHDEWWWMYFLGLYDTISVMYSAQVYDRKTTMLMKKIRKEADK